MMLDAVEARCPTSRALDHIALSRQINLRTSGLAYVTAIPDILHG
jgi:hypothetical protein